MMNKTLYTVIKESLTQALFQLMHTQSFDKISITALCEKAGVSRISFYRHFEQKEDIVIRYMHEQIVKHFQTMPEPHTTNAVFIKMFEWAIAESEVIDLLYQQNLSHFLLHFVRYCCGAKPEFDNEKAYHCGVLVGICFGLLDEWIRRGKNESPEQMAEILQNNLQLLLVKWQDSGKSE